MTSNEKINAKIGSRELAAWTQIKDSAEREIENSRRVILMDKEIIALAEKKIKEEKSINLNT